jgi:hypothetical protein
MIPVFTKTAAFVVAASAGMALPAASCPSQKAAITGPSNTPIIRFAIVGLVDIDNDGKSDIGLIRRIIEQGGGTIDAEINIDGEQTGRLQRNTDYLVLGTLPDKTTTSPTVAQRFDAFMRRATELNIRVINVDGLLETGHRRTAPNLDSESIFRQRRPPPRRAGSEY